MNASHYEALEQEFAWLASRIDGAIRAHFQAESEPVPKGALPPLSRRSALGRFVADHALGAEERVVLGLALAPHVRPALLDAFLLRNPHTERRFTEFGGVTGISDGAFRPTLETAAFVLAGADIARRMALRAVFDAAHVFSRESVLEIGEAAPGSTIFETPLRAAPAFVAAMGTGESCHDGVVGGRFPARRIATALAWDDIALAPSTRQDLQEIQAWLADPRMFDDDPALARHLRPGYRALFHGPPGTGKTLAAALLGKASGCDVYRVDLSLVTSKWVGETEKNLAEIFMFAERHRCILFFDEADSIFGKRSSSSGGQDRYANLEVSYLLQRIEDFRGLVILATNIKGNLDEAFARRFETMIYFGAPDAAARLKIWRSLFPDRRRIEARDLERLADEHELTGSTIVNVARHAVSLMRREGDETIARHHVDEAIRREYRKVGKTLAGPVRWSTPPSSSSCDS